MSSNQQQFPRINMQGQFRSIDPSIETRQTYRKAYDVLFLLLPSPRQASSSQLHCESRSGYLSAAVSYLSTFITSPSSSGTFINLESHNSSYYVLKHESRLSLRIITSNILYFVIRCPHYRVKITTVIHGLISPRDAY